ncbi:MAG TPA: FixH family protein [Ureibacillus sp.]|nr:FixH family protein [Ureibacillus sp.]
MKKWLISFIAVPFLLVGCSSNNEAETNDDVVVDVAALEVKVDILTPEKVALNESVELAAHVYQNSGDLDDASVKFEVWESGDREQAQMIEGKLDSKGVYKAEMTFDHDGVYYMFAHTTAPNGMHVMPKQQIVVGTPDMSTVKEDTSSDSMDMSDQEEEGSANSNTEHGSHH